MNPNKKILIAAYLIAPLIIGVNLVASGNYLLDTVLQYFLVIAHNTLIYYVIKRHLKNNVVSAIYWASVALYFLLLSLGLFAVNDSILIIMRVIKSSLYASILILSYYLESRITKKVFNA